MGKTEAHINSLWEKNRASLGGDWAILSRACQPSKLHSASPYNFNNFLFRLPVPRGHVLFSYRKGKSGERLWIQWQRGSKSERGRKEMTRAWHPALLRVDRFLTCLRRADRVSSVVWYLVSAEGGRQVRPDLGSEIATLTSSEPAGSTSEAQQRSPAVSSGSAANILTDAVETSLPVSGLVAIANFLFPPSLGTKWILLTHSGCEKWRRQLAPLANTAVSPGCTRKRSAVRKRQFRPTGFPRQQGFGNQSA